MKPHRVLGIVGAIMSAFLLVGCAKRLSGTYVGQIDAGMTIAVSVEFSSSGTAFLRVAGNEGAGKYRVEGNRIILEMPNQNSVLTIVDDDTLTTSTPYGDVVLKKKT